MVGVNHEFGRELIWRYRPTARDGLHRFWDRSTSIAGESDDLPTIDQTWAGELGTLLGGAGQVVLVVRGEAPALPRTRRSTRPGRSG
jgi:hypothetical protein